MARISSQVITDKPTEVEEAFVPLFLRIAICTTRVMCLSPAQLRRAGGHWRLAVSRPLVKVQRLMLVILGVLSTSAYIFDFLSEKQHRVRVGTTLLTAVGYIIETCLLLLAYSFGVLTGPRRLKQAICMLQQIHKLSKCTAKSWKYGNSLRNPGAAWSTQFNAVTQSLEELIPAGLDWNLFHNKTSIQRRNIRLQYSKVKHVLLILYIIWHIICYYMLFYAFIYHFYIDRNPADLLYIPAAYIACGVSFLQLEWSMTLVEIGSTLKLVNNELEFMLKNTATNPQFGNANTDIRRHSLSYDLICEMLRQMDDNGPFILFYFLLVILHSLIPQYNLIVVLRSRRIWDIAHQLNWIILHFSHFVAMVDPCHWIQVQKERTRHLLTGLACQAGRRHLDRVLLASFLQQLQMSGFRLGPCGLFTLNRPLITSLFAGIGTYLIIMVQSQNVFVVI